MNNKFYFTNVKIKRKQKMSALELNEMPSHIKSPVADYYVNIMWNHGFERWNLVRFSTPMDGSCLFHAMTNAFFEPYYEQKINGKKCSRKQIIVILRKELAKRLGSVNPHDPNGKTYYDLLNSGNTAEFATVVPEFSLEYMQNELDSDSPIGYGYFEFIGDCINKDIYILEAKRRDVYIMDNPSLVVKGNRKSIILYYIDGHYELVGVKNIDGTFSTHFDPHHSLILFLKSKLKK